MVVDPTESTWIDWPALLREADAMLAEHEIPRTPELTSVEQVELWADGGLLDAREWAERSMRALGRGWEDIGPLPKWSRIALSRRTGKTR